MAMGCPHQGRSGGLNATITSRPFDLTAALTGWIRCHAQAEFGSRRRAFLTNVRVIGPTGAVRVYREPPKSGEFRGRASGPWSPQAAFFVRFLAGSFRRC